MPIFLAASITLSKEIDLFHKVILLSIVSANKNTSCKTRATFNLSSFISKFLISILFKLISPELAS